jgi:hypothetical protein
LLRCATGALINIQAYRPLHKPSAFPVQEAEQCTSHIMAIQSKILYLHALVRKDITTYTIFTKLTRIVHGTKVGQTTYNRHLTKNSLQTPVRGEYI